MWREFLCITNQYSDGSEKHHKCILIIIWITVHWAVADLALKTRIVCDKPQYCLWINRCQHQNCCRQALSKDLHRNYWANALLISLGCADTLIWWFRNLSVNCSSVFICLCTNASFYVLAYSFLGLLCKLSLAVSKCLVFLIPSWHSRERLIRDIKLSSCTFNVKLYNAPKVQF